MKNQNNDISKIELFGKLLKLTTGFYAMDKLVIGVGILSKDRYYLLSRYSYPMGKYFKWSITQSFNITF